MSRSPLFSKLARTIATANFCDKNHISSRDGISVLKSEMLLRRHSRQEFLTDVGKFALLGGAIGVGSGSFRSVVAVPITFSISLNMLNLKYLYLKM